MIFRPANDVSAVVLSTGERTTQDAIASLHRQTMPVLDIIMVRGVAPFHMALNAGAAQVKTPFFIQVDADMVLDCDCVAALRRRMRRHVGIAVGHLRDALVEQVVGVKLFRTACFDVAQFQDTISPDTDFVDAIARDGWNTIYIGRRWRAGPHPWATFGEHRPDYAPAYTYQKYLLEGRRYRYRQKVEGLRWLLGRLAASRHPAALIAQIALTRGIFLTENRDALGTMVNDEAFAGIEHFLSSAQDPLTRLDITVAPDLPLRERFRAFFRLGVELFNAGDLPTFKQCMDALDNVEHCNASLASKIALCKALGARDISDQAIEAHYCSFRSFIAPQDLWSAGIERGAPADRSGLDQVAGEFNLESIAAYAANVGLTKFVIDGSPAAEYRTDRFSGPATCRATGRTVTTAIDAHGRPRISAPFSPFGHVICTHAERATSIFWCFDLLRSGYAFAHLPTLSGPRRVVLARQLAKNCLARVRFPSPASLGFKFRTIARFRRSQAKRPFGLSQIYRRVGDYSAFAGHGLARREVFGHQALALPKAYPDSQVLLGQRGLPRRLVEAGRFAQINLYTTDFYDLPEELFWHPEINWHQQQHGLKGLIAAAGLWIRDREVTITTLQSDLCQQLYRHAVLRNTCKTQVKTHFKYWYAILFNAVLDFCIVNGLSVVYCPTGEQIVRDTTIALDLFLRIYNYPEKHYLCQRTNRGGTEYWEIPIDANLSRIARLRQAEPIAAQDKRKRTKAFCVFIRTSAETGSPIVATVSNHNPIRPEVRT
jgi:hypothetical protein